MGTVPTVRFLVDAQLPPALVRLLQNTGHACEHAESVALLRADDKDIWDFAVSNNAVIITKDEDFADLATLRGGGPPIVWLRIGNCSNRALLTWFEPLLPSIIARLAAGDTLVEVI